MFVLAFLRQNIHLISMFSLLHWADLQYFSQTQFIKNEIALSCAVQHNNSNSIIILCIISFPIDTHATSMACHIQPGGDMLCDHRHKAHPQEKGHRNFVPCEPRQQNAEETAERCLGSVQEISISSSHPKGKHVINAELFPWKVLIPWKIQLLRKRNCALALN